MNDKVWLIARFESEFCDCGLLPPIKIAEEMGKEYDIFYRYTTLTCPLCGERGHAKRRVWWVIEDTREYVEDVEGKYIIDDIPDLTLEFLLTKQTEIGYDLNVKIPARIRVLERLSVKLADSLIKYRRGNG